MRILVTGSRTWPREKLFDIGNALLDQAPEGDSSVTLVHGACPKGADQMADAFGKTFGWTIEPHPAQWSKLGKQAGYIRNAEMVKLGADICLAFIKNNSKGSTMCADLAENAGIPTIRFT